jgi:hypothetical protein
LSDHARTETKAAAESPHASAHASAHAGLLQRKCACGSSAGITGHCSDCDGKRLTLQRSAVGKDELRTIPPVVDRVLSGAGEPLNPQARAQMESHLGHDFGRVRVHTDARAAESARAVNANAYTVGQQVVFASGKYQPQTSEGRRLLAHELTHVAQQAAGKVPGAQAAGDASEAEADRNAGAIGGPRAAGVRHSVTAGVVQRQPEARDGETDKILGAAVRAAREPDDRTLMMIRGSEITYRLIGKFLPGYSAKLSGVGYDQNIKGVKAERVKGVKAENADSISVTVGRDFILGTNAATLKTHAAEVEQELRKSGVAPSVAAAAPAAAAAQTTEAAPTVEAAKTEEGAQGPQVAPPVNMSANYTPAGGGELKNRGGDTYEKFKGDLGELRATSEGGVKGGAAGYGTRAAPKIEFEVLLKAFPGMAKDVGADKNREEQARKYVDSLNLAFKVMKIDTVEAQANYLSHAFVESAQFRQFIETQGWLNHAKDESKKLDQSWVTDPKKLKLDDKYLEKTYNAKPPESEAERKTPKAVEAADRKRTVSPTGEPLFYGRGPVQVTHNYNYMEVIAMLEVAVEQYQKEAAKPDITPEAKSEALSYAALAREAANAVKTDPEEAANPKYTFLFSAAYMKRRRADVTVADPDKEGVKPWSGADAKSRWVAGGLQKEGSAQADALKDKQGAYDRILPLLMCEAKKAGVKVKKAFKC